MSIKVKIQKEIDGVIHESQVIESSLPVWLEHGWEKVEGELKRDTQNSGGSEPNPAAEATAATAGADAAQAVATAGSTAVEIAAAQNAAKSDAQTTGRPGASK